MIDLRKGLGAPPNAFPGVRMVGPSSPSGIPGSAPLMPISMRAQSAMNGCAGCTRGDSKRGIAGLASPWYQPLWMKGLLVGAGAAILAAMTYGIYRVVR